MTKAPILRSTPTDWKATGVIAVVCAIAVGGAAITANINQAHLSQAAVPGDEDCLLYTSPSPRDRTRSRMPSSA